MGNLKHLTMKLLALAALIAVATAGTPPTVGLGHGYVPANREDFDNAKELWKGDWAKYRAAHPADQDCSISESDNWKGAQQCSQSWNAEVPDSAKEAAGAPVMMAVREPHS